MPTFDTLRWENSGLSLLDQRLLPGEIKYLRCKSAEDTADAIQRMVVRGAPAIGCAAAYGVALEARRFADSPPDQFHAAIAAGIERLAHSRPTAVNLAWAIGRMRERLAPVPLAERVTAAWNEAKAIADEDVALNESIGKHGLVLLEREHAARKRPINILTHCNAGWIATVDWGTVTAPIFMAHDAGIPIHVWVDETRPRNQGLLTAWELTGHGVPHTLVTDNAGGHLMQRGMVDLVLVGADRVSRRGDVCNKIGTYLKAVAARANDIPFYACVPTPTIDWSVENAFEEIPIEERPPDEVRVVRGIDADGRISQVRIAPAMEKVANPAFDVTPASFVTGIITEKGVVRANEKELLGFWPRHRESKAYLT